MTHPTPPVTGARSTWYFLDPAQRAWIPVHACLAAQYADAGFLVCLAGTYSPSVVGLFSEGAE